ncbi:hypothetical protein [Streptodolium elevatio]|uniref:Head-to-tail adaptor n=1 Tax=Streptodolium elevatio TaxID=3157996 RepID=A0ABV3DLH3_9ACTN
MAAFATIEDYTARTATTVSGAEAAQIQAYLADASAIIRSRMPTGFTPDGDMAKAIAVAIVRRVKVNPGGYRSRTLGEYSETLGEAGGLYITDGEVAALLGGSDGSGDQAFSLISETGPAWVSPYEGCW